MRTIIALGFLMLGLSGAAPEPEYSALFPEYFHDGGSSAASLVEIESSTGRSDRLPLAATGPHALAVQIFRPGDDGSHVALASADPNFTGAIPAAAGGNEADQPAAISLDDLCNALYTSAQDNDLPIAFFANLIWQESRLRADDVSKKGAMGIAQFMPDTAVETGLDDPFDPMQAIPASARFLQKLWMQFGNLGFVAAAYNAGPHRVIDWLEHRSSLPRETRGYVLKVTGLPVDAWRTMPIDKDALTFVQHLPCRSLPAFASLEQEQLQQAQIVEAKMIQPNSDERPGDPSATHAPAHAATRDRDHAHHETHAARERHVSKHEAAHATTHAIHEKRKSA